MRLARTPQIDRLVPVPYEHHELGVRPPSQQAVLSIRARVDECDAATFVHESLESIHVYMREHDMLLRDEPAHAG